MVRQWKRNTEGYTPQQLREKFHQHDTNGDGKLSRKEFAHLLYSFGISLSDSELVTLMDRFDDDGDDSIDMHEFFEFIENERHSLHLDPQQDTHHLRESISKERQSQSRDDVPSRPLSERDGARGTHQDKIYLAPPYQRSWDFSPARRRPHTSTSTYEEGIAPLPVSPLKSAHANSGYDAVSSARAHTVSDVLERSSKMLSSRSNTSRRSGYNGNSESEKSVRRGSSTYNDYRSQREVEDSKEKDAVYNSDVRNASRNGGDSPPDRTGRGREGECKGRGGSRGDESVSVEDALWAVKMLQAQAHVEKRLGGDYY